MYVVILNDFLNKTQKQIHATSDLFQAKDVCESAALNFVLSKEGDKYKNNSPFRTRSGIKKGYNLVVSRSPFCKFTVLLKHPDGVFYSGNVQKIYTYYIVKIQNNRSDLRYTSDMTEDQKAYYCYAVDSLKQISFADFNHIEDKKMYSEQPEIFAKERLEKQQEYKNKISDVMRQITLLSFEETLDCDEQII